ncbi:unnamed protein product [Paramecium primaurelia]|uniref:Protein kinase domain-containing protein n=1 Tax=Paramecium primaurelia TaxID=5886 RepID=A0A8S1N9Q2_PARPR|nr:unnamed protein product [Paramecium primaurelia]
MQTLQNRYQYYEKDFLGRGSFGKVYKGKDTQTGEAVAIKIMDMTLFDDQFMIDALNKEIAIMKQLQHPTIVRLIETFGDSKQTVKKYQLLNYVMVVIQDTVQVDMEECLKKLQLNRFAIINGWILGDDKWWIYSQRYQTRKFTYIQECKQSC